MNLKLKTKEVIKEIKNAPDSDDVSGIIRRLIDELIDADIMGLELRLFLKHLHKELVENKIKAKDFIEINNIKRGIEISEHFAKILGMKVYQYELN